MSENGSGAKSPPTSTFDVLADVQGAASAGLGLPMVLAPGRFLDAIGISDDAESRAWLYAVGAREHLAAGGILAFEQRKLFMWLRVAGDLKDLALLVRAWQTKRDDKTRLTRAMGAVGAILAVDLVTAIGITRTRGEDAAATNVREAAAKETSGPTHVKTSITIRKPEDELRAAFGSHEWAYDPAELEQAGALRLTAAPGGQGTEIHVDFKPDEGAVKARLARVTGTAPDQQIRDDLRHFKQIVETGEVVRSDGSPEGQSSKRQIKQRPASPVGGEG